MNRSRFLYKVINEQRNIHRLSRKVMPNEELTEFIQKCKEYSEFKVREVNY